MTDLLTPEQAAERLNLKPRMVRRWCQRGQLGRKYGGRYLIDEKELASFKPPKPGPKPGAAK